jgi:transcriptional regulator with XRE-family HTH domain
MAENWQHLEQPWERLRWARLNARPEPFDQLKAAAESLNVKPGTYRTYEQPKAEGGRAPQLAELQRFARKFKVSWVWIASGQGSPFDEPTSPFLQVAETVAERLEAVPPEKREDAIGAIYGVLNAFAKQA